MSVKYIKDEYMELAEVSPKHAFGYLIESYAEEYSNLDRQEKKELEDFIKRELVMNIYDVRLSIDTAGTVEDNDLLEYLSAELLKVNEKNVSGLILYGIASYRKGNTDTAFESIRSALVINFIYTCNYSGTAKLITELHELLREHPQAQLIDSILDVIEEENDLIETEQIAIALMKNYLKGQIISEQMVERIQELEVSPEKMDSEKTYIAFLDNGNRLEQCNPENKMITSPDDVQKYVSKLLNIEEVTTVIDHKKEEEDSIKSLQPNWLKDDVYVERTDSDFEYIYEDMCTYESLFLITLDKHLHLINHHLLQIGGAYSVQMPFKQLIEKAGHDKAKFVIIVHNHPNNIAQPSEGDKYAAKFKKKSLLRHGFTFLDNVIVTTDNSYYSFRTNGLL